MQNIHQDRAKAAVRAALVVASIVAISAWASAAVPAGGRSPETAPVAPAPAPPRIADTRTNLQAAFDQEMNAKQRYLAEAKRALREGHPGVARLFRACARAEEAHAERHVAAISAAGGLEARTTVKRFEVGSTAENLAAAIERERYEVEEFYPPFIERARADGFTMAVRSLTFALAAEREHLALLRAAQESLGRADAVPRFHVCPTCGKTVEKLEFVKCPNCFSPARKFVAVL
jgi:rubrerythrin